MIEQTWDIAMFHLQQTIFFMHVLLSELLNFLIVSFCFGHLAHRRWFVNAQLSLHHAPNVFNKIELWWSKTKRIRPKHQCKFIIMFLCGLSISGYFRKASIPGKPWGSTSGPANTYLILLDTVSNRCWPGTLVGVRSTRDSWEELVIVSESCTVIPFCTEYYCRRKQCSNCFSVQWGMFWGFRGAVAQLCVVALSLDTLVCPLGKSCRPIAKDPRVSRSGTAVF